MEEDPGISGIVHKCYKVPDSNVNEEVEFDFSELVISHILLVMNI